MFDDSTGPRVFGLPPGVSFATELVRGFHERMLGAPPDAIARAEIFLNTARMARSVRAAFAARGASLLPRLRLVTDLARDPLPGLAPPVPDLRRRLELSQLVAKLAEADGRLLQGSSLFELSDSLARLMAEMHEEGVPPTRLAAPDIAGDHAEHWDRSLRFLGIVTDWFSPDAAPDTAARQRRMTEHLIGTWAASPPDHPVIVAGSTGSRGTTSLLMEAVARLPQGAVILPGFDFDLPTKGWSSLVSGEVPQEDHPQFRFATLLARLATDLASVRRWTQTPAPSAARNRLVSLALRPAPMTDQWMSEGRAMDDLAEATEGLSLVEAATPRAEAMAIATALREAAEDGIAAALVTPDRVLARRVAAALDRWGIVPDDSAGEPLSQTATGRLLRQVSALFGQRMDAGQLVALLKHPLVASGADRGGHLRLSRDLELSLRRHGPAFPGSADILTWGAAKADDRAEWSQWAAACLTGPETAGTRPIAEWTAALMERASRLASGPGSGATAARLWSDTTGLQARALLEQLLREADHGVALSPAAFHDLLGRLLSAEAKRDPVAVHPLISIWGTLEARVQNAELMILAGLNEGSWPESPTPDPWMSRQMRLAAGLRLPERVVGLSAHDFQQAVAARRVILSRSRRDAEAEAIPSRWLARLTNLLAGLRDGKGPDLLEDMRARGDRLLRLAALLDEVARVPAASRPAPRPPVADRPSELPVTAIRTLLLNPYDIYARHVLRLRALDPLAPEPDARARGETLHGIMERFILERPPAETATEMRTRLMRVADEVLAAEVPWVANRRLWRARLAAISEWLVRGEARRAAEGRPVVVEQKGSVDLPGPGFRLTARPDRIDEISDGRLAIFDYKSGEPPSRTRREKVDHQLTLEAGMAMRGGFAALGEREVASLVYISLGKDENEVDASPDLARVNEVWSSLERLIERYRDPATGYIARLYERDLDRVSDYDHLSRLGEWGLTDTPVPEDLA